MLPSFLLVQAEYQLLSDIGVQVYYGLGELACKVQYVAVCSFCEGNNCDNL